MATYAQLKNSRATYQAFAQLMAQIALNNYLVPCGGQFSTMRDATQQTVTMRNGAEQDRFLQLLSGIVSNTKLV